MLERRSHTPVQIDPVRARLGKPAQSRDVQCPACQAIYSTTFRWQMLCPECGHRWTDRSSRTLLDEFRDRRLQLISVLLAIAAAVIAFGTLGAFIAWLFIEAAADWGWERVYGLAALFVASLVGLLILARLFSATTDRHT